MNFWGSHEGIVNKFMTFDCLFCSKQQRRWLKMASNWNIVVDDESQALPYNYKHIDHHQHRGVILMCDWLLSFGMISFHSQFDSWFMIDCKKQNFIFRSSSFSFSLVLIAFALKNALKCHINYRIFYWQLHPPK